MWLVTVKAPGIMPSMLHGEDEDEEREDEREDTSCPASPVLSRSMPATNS